MLSPGLTGIVYPVLRFVVANPPTNHRKEKDPFKPKHPITAFFAFSHSRRPALLEEKKPITEVLFVKKYTLLFILSSVLVNSFCCEYFVVATLLKRIFFIFLSQSPPSEKFVMNHESVCRFQRYWEKNGKL